MTRSIPFLRATAQVATLALGSALLAPACAGAFTPAKSQASSENLPLNLEPKASAAHTSSGGASIVRTIVGLAIVIAVIWGLTWILRQFKSRSQGRAAGTGLDSVATLPLGSGRTVHLVRAGNDYVLLGSAENSVVPIYRYTEQQARDAGLLSLAGETVVSAGGPVYAAGGPASSPAGGRTPPIVQEAARPKSPVERLREWTVRR